jgi:beta-phosphoglucomutase-like phosphatase (HAD superfamily)
MVTASIIGFQPRAIFFDLDDTILVDDGLSEKCWRSVCEKFAPQIGTITGSQLFESIRAASDRKSVV